MTDDWIAVLIWTVILYPIWSPRCRRIRREMRQNKIAKTVSKALTKTGPAWEQVSPWPECFDDMKGIDDDV